MRATIVIGLIALSVAPASAQDAPTAAEFNKLKQEVRELRQMLMQAMQIEQQRYDLLLKMINSGSIPEETPRPAPAAAPEPRAARQGAITGSVQLRGGAGQPVYIYVENVPGPPVRGRKLDIVQKGKQFSPQVTAVPRGTEIFFPNGDSVAHNVFSTSAGKSFDLGLLRAGERGRAVTLTSPGVVEVYCNMHAKMWAEVLVVPNTLFTRAEADGRFRLNNVPAGERVIVAWTAGAQPVRKTVQVSGSGAEVSFALDVPPRRAHNRKDGLPYDGYQ